MQAPLENLFQGPIADALTHVGQIAILRRMAGEPVKAENYYKAEIVWSRRCGADCAEARVLSCNIAGFGLVFRLRVQ